MDDAWLLDILDRNKDKSFVKRIMTPDKYPSLNNPDGTTSSHLMSWASAGGKFAAFPTILYDGKGLKKFDDWREAFGQAQQTGNYIEFDTPEEAEWFSKNYKRYWDMNK